MMHRYSFLAFILSMAFGATAQQLPYLDQSGYLHTKEGKLLIDHDTKVYLNGSLAGEDFLITMRYYFSPNRFYGGKYMPWTISYLSDGKGQLKELTIGGSIDYYLLNEVSQMDLQSQHITIKTNQSENVTIDAFSSLDIEDALNESVALENWKKPSQVVKLDLRDAALFVNYQSVGFSRLEGLSHVLAFAVRDAEHRIKALHILDFAYEQTYAKPGCWGGYILEYQGLDMHIWEINEPLYHALPMHQQDTLVGHFQGIKADKKMYEQGLFELVKTLTFTDSTQFILPDQTYDGFEDFRKERQRIEQTCFFYGPTWYQTDSSQRITAILVPYHYME